MKLLLDACVWGGAGVALREHGHDVVWAGDWESDPGDREILRIAYASGRVLVTLDKDFGELAVVYGFPHNGIVRLVDVSARRQAAVCNRVLGDHGAELRSGAIVVAEPDRVRVRK